MPYNPDQVTDESPNLSPSSPDPNPSQHQSPSPNDGGQEDSSASDDDLRAYRVPPGYTGDDAAEAETTAAGDPPRPEVLLSPQEFHAVFCALIGAPNMAISPPLQSLTIKPDDQGARHASAALYETCCEISWLRWMVQPEGKWARRVLPIAVFAGGLQAAVREELRQRQSNVNASYTTQGEDRAGAGDGSAPAGDGRYEDDGVIELEVGQSRDDEEQAA